MRSQISERSLPAKLSDEEQHAYWQIEELMLLVDGQIDVLEPDDEGPLHDWACSLMNARASYRERL